MAECTIYDKLRYIAETKDLIKAAIEAQDVEVLESATFRQYAEYITQIRKVSSVNGMQGDVTITAKDLGALTEIPSEYITETELNEKGYLTAVPDVYITEDELSSQLADKVSQNGLNEAIAGVRNDIPTNVSQLTNDSGYITLNEVPKVDLSGYALKSEIPDISVKQDKLTAGNGISITDNVISLDYEYDLFEVVQSLPTENISDNKVYLLLDSNGSEGNTYVEYLYVNGQWEELGKFKVNIDLSGYATEEWVNSQGFLKEHQDISNLATKQELATKQDVISDLDTIRSGAAKGATALQSVPEEYAKKTDIPDISTKQDVIPDLEAIRSGAALGSTALQSVPDTYALKSEIPDISTKQDTLVSGTNIKTLNGNSLLGSGDITIDTNVDLTGYATEQWVNEQGFLKEHQDISNLATKEELNAKQDTINDLETIRSGAAKGATALQSVPSEYVTETELNNKGYLTSVPDTYALKSEIPDITNLATKAELNEKQDTLVSGTNIKTVNGTSLLGSGNIVIEASADNVPTVQTTVEGTTNNYIYSSGRNDKYGVISDIKNLVSYEEDKASINTGWVYWGTSSVIDAAYGWSINAATTSKAGLMTASDKSKLDGINLATKQDTLVSGTNIKTINGESILGSGNITIEGGSGGNVDLTDYYTKTETNALVNPKLEQITLTQAEYDALSTKEDNVLYIISDAEDLKFKTINGQQITGEGNIEIEASAANVPTVQTTPNGTTSNYIYSTISYTNPQYSVISDISNFITYSTDKASIATYQRYWGQESANSNQNWSINAATTSQAGLMSASDKTKLDGIDLTPYATKTELNAKQDTLVSGTNIKTVNGISLLGEGNITISGEGGSDLSGYYTKAEIDEMIGGASATINQINNLVG